MKNALRILSVLALVSLLGRLYGRSTGSPGSTGRRALQPRRGAKTVVVKDVQRQPAPAFDSACTADDEGKVAPVAVMPDRPLKIAVLGLENNPFWIPVKEGTMKAAEELKPYNVTVDWIVPGDNHTADVFGPAIEAAIGAGV